MLNKQAIVANEDSIDMQHWDEHSDIRFREANSWPPCLISIIFASSKAFEIIGMRLFGGGFFLNMFYLFRFHPEKEGLHRAELRCTLYSYFLGR
jgi:hypothetical protein